MEESSLLDDDQNHRRDELAKSQLNNNVVHGQQILLDAVATAASAAAAAAIDSSSGNSPSMVSSSNLEFDHASNSVLLESGSSLSSFQGAVGSFLMVFFLVIVGVMVLGCIRTCVQGSHSASKIEAAFKQEVALLNTGNAPADLKNSTGKTSSSNSRSRNASQQRAITPVGGHSNERHSHKKPSNLPINGPATNLKSWIGGGQQQHNQSATPSRRNNYLLTDHSGSAKSRSRPSSRSRGRSLSSSDVDDDDLALIPSSGTVADQHRARLHSSIFSNLDELDSDSEDDERHEDDDDFFGGSTTTTPTNSTPTSTSFASGRRRRPRSATGVTAGTN